MSPITTKKSFWICCLFYFIVVCIYYSLLNFFFWPLYGFIDSKAEQMTRNRMGERGDTQQRAGTQTRICCSEDRASVHTELILNDALVYFILLSKKSCSWEIVSDNVERSLISDYFSFLLRWWSWRGVMLQARPCSSPWAPGTAARRTNSVFWRSWSDCRGTRPSSIMTPCCPSSTTSLPLYVPFQ